MYDAIEITEKRLADYEKSFEFESEAEMPNFEIGNSKLGIGVIMVMAAFVGIWGTTCLVSGLASSASIQEIGRGLITAITGM